MKRGIVQRTVDVSLLTLYEAFDRGFIDPLPPEQQKHEKPIDGSECLARLQDGHDNHFTIFDVVEPPHACSLTQPTRILCGHQRLCALRELVRRMQSEGSSKSDIRTLLAPISVWVAHRTYSSEDAVSWDRFQLSEGRNMEPSDNDESPF